MNRKDRVRKLERAHQHQRFCKARGKLTTEGDLGGKPPGASRALRRRLGRAGRAQWRGRFRKKGEARD